MRDAYCSTCGTKFEQTETYPRICEACGAQVWANPVPVAVLLLPIVDAGREGLLVVRRNIPPMVGHLGLVGGFVEEHESWQRAASRELMEEVNVGVPAEKIVPFWVASSAPWPNRILIFGTAPAMDVQELPPFMENSESQERGVIFGPGGEAEAEDGLAFPLHVEAARRYFGARGVGGPLGFVRR